MYFFFRTVAVNMFDYERMKNIVASVASLPQGAVITPGDDDSLDISFGDVIRCTVDDETILLLGDGVTTLVDIQPECENFVETVLESFFDETFSGEGCRTRQRKTP